MIDIPTESLNELIAEIHGRTGYDFSRYSKSSFKRRILSALETFELATLADLRDRFVADLRFRERLVEGITVNVTEMFRDPAFFRSLREKIAPALATYPWLKVWNAGCSSGEEVYSVAILLEEAGLLDRCTIYGTDINQQVLELAREGIYKPALMEEFELNYRRSGGTRSLSHYYTLKHGRVKMSQTLASHMVFGLHNLATDSSFNEFNLIICRNVLIYFEKELQDRVLHLFHESLPVYGYLGLGHKESLRFSTCESHFEPTDKDERIYRKVQ